MRAVALPYRQSSNAVTLGVWKLGTSENSIDLPEAHPAWDATIDVKVSRPITIDGSMLAQETSLSLGASVRIVAGWYCEAARSRSFPWRHDLSLPNNFGGTLELVLPAGRLATSVELVVGVVLIAPGRNPSPVSAGIPGSWLFRNTVELRLEPTNGRFPMEWTNFQASGLPGAAAWYLDWPTQDFDAPVLGALRLRLNSSKNHFSETLGLESNEPQRRLLVQAAMLDVAKQLVTAALNSEEFVEQADSYPEGSIGFCVRLLIRQTFPGVAMRTLRDKLSSHAGDFHVELQAQLPLTLESPE